MRTAYSSQFSSPRNLNISQNTKSNFNKLLIDKGTYTEKTPNNNNFANRHFEDFMQFSSRCSTSENILNQNMRKTSLNQNNRKSSHFQ